MESVNIVFKLEVRTLTGDAEGNRAGCILQKKSLGQPIAYKGVDNLTIQAELHFQFACVQPGLIDYKLEAVVCKLSGKHFIGACKIVGTVGLRIGNVIFIRKPTVFTQ